MTNDRTKPDACRIMAEVREGIDRLDAQIVALIGERFRYMDAAARIKQQRASVRDEVRKAEVIAHVKRAAEQADIPVQLIEDIYDRLVEGSIAYELERFDALRAKGRNLVGFDPNAAAD